MAQNSGGSLGLQNDLRLATEDLHYNMHVAEYKHVIGLVFVKFMSASFEEQHTKLEPQKTGSTSD